MQLLQKIAAEHLTTLIIVTHSREVAAIAERHVEMRDGKVAHDSGDADTFA
jgi:ABC-type lipoprotein export system ATPase subunit